MSNPLPPNGIRWDRGSGRDVTDNYLLVTGEAINPVDLILLWNRS